MSEQTFSLEDVLTMALQEPPYLEPSTHILQFRDCLFICQNRINKGNIDLLLINQGLPFVGRFISITYEGALEDNSILRIGFIKESFSAIWKVFDVQLKE
jgi:hypothetical protein